MQMQNQIQADFIAAAVDLATHLAAYDAKSLRRTATMLDRPAGRARVAKHLIRQQADAPTHAAQLVLAIICQAVDDLVMHCVKPHEWADRADAHAFFRRGRHVHYCELVGLDPEYVVAILRQVGIFGGATLGSAKVKKAMPGPLGGV